MYGKGYIRLNMVALAKEVLPDDPLERGSTQKSLETLANPCARAVAEATHRNII